MRLLVADDDPLLRDLISHTLVADGHDVVAIDNGGAVFDAIAADRPDLIMLDGLMPVIDGFEVLRRLKQDPATASIPVIMLTALKREADIVNALKEGAVDYLVKPFFVDELRVRISRHLPAGGEAMGIAAGAGRR